MVTSLKREKECFVDISFNFLIRIESGRVSDFLSFVKSEVKKDNFIILDKIPSLEVIVLNDYLPAATRSLRPLPALNFGTILS